MATRLYLRLGELRGAVFLCALVMEQVTERRKTCEGCEFLGSRPTDGLRIFACVHPTVSVPFAVPYHAWVDRAGAQHNEFMRVPIECPLPDSLVLKTPARGQRSA